MMMYDAVPTNSEHRYHVVGAYGQCTCKTLRFTILFSPQRQKVNKCRRKSDFRDFQYTVETSIKVTMLYYDTGLYYNIR